MTILVPELESIANATPNAVLWTDDEIAIVEEYYPRGVPASQLAKYLSKQNVKRSVCSVEHLIRRRGLKRVRT